MKRAQKAAILKDLEKKIVLIVGPRQAGKTWLAKDIAKQFPNSVYLNYDQVTDREIIQAQSWLDSTDLLVLDELHKMPGWKNYLKGLYDTKPPSLRLLVTGSARLDTFDNLGDSLAGRYFRHRLLPISLAELTQIGINAMGDTPLIERLLSYGNFPEPFLSENIVEANRWRMQYANSLLSTDIFEIDRIQNFKAMKLVFELLQNRVGSPVSYQSLSEDVGVSATTIKKYIQILEALYIVFRVTPYSKNIARSLLKEPKIYFFDTGLVEGDEGAKFENFVAISLLKHVYGKVDYLAEKCKLHYLRTKEGVEVDFTITKNDKVEDIIEVKVSNSKLSASLLKFQKKYSYSATQVVKHLRNEHFQNDIKIVKAENFLNSLFL